MGIKFKNKSKKANFAQKNRQKILVSLVFLFIIIISLIVILKSGVLTRKSSQTSLETKAAGYSCPTTSDQSYQSMGTYKPRANQEQNPEINITLRGYTEVNQKPELTAYGGDTDPIMPPNFGTLFPNRLPSMVKTYSVYQWDYANNRRGSEIEKNWPVNLIGLYTIPGEPVVAPKAGRDIGGGHVLMVLYATENTIVFTHSTSDLYTDENGNWTSDGYLIYVDDICVDRNLLTIYQQQNNAGRGSLPVLATGQVFGYGKGVDIKVGIRDSMDWMDPRAQKDWWQGFNTLPPPPEGSAISPTAIPTVRPTFPQPTTNNLQPTTTRPSPTIQNIQPTTNLPAGKAGNPPSTTIPTITLTPTPTKTLTQIVVTHPLYIWMKDLSASFSYYLKVILP